MKTLKRWSLMQINYTTGYAGTGKSTALLDLLKQVNPEEAIVLCPTHKAAHRLMNSTQTLVEIKTIHSILGWIPGINEEAENINHIDVIIKLDHPLNSYTHIIIDEGGMMSEEMFMEITAKLEEAYDYDTEHIVIDVFLDPYQLLPVKGRQIQIDPETTTRLITQHRSESKDIVETFTKFVHYLEGTNKNDLKINYSTNILKGDIRDFREGDRLLAYTNQCVGNYNTKIAKQLDIKSFIGQKVQLGNYSTLVKVDKFIKPKINKLVEAYESGTLKMQNSQINKKFLKSSLQALIDHKDIQFIEANGIIIPVILGIAEAYKLRQQTKVRAVENKAEFKWVYAMDRAYTMDYSFASTVHKAQGSEFDRVWIVKEDIQKSITNNYYENYARLMYVALSRAKRSIFIL